jgi:hypothetical protein
MSSRLTMNWLFDVIEQRMKHCAWFPVFPIIVHEVVGNSRVKVTEYCSKIWSWVIEAEMRPITQKHDIDKAALLNLSAILESVVPWQAMSSSVTYVHQVHVQGYKLILTRKKARDYELCGSWRCVYLHDALSRLYFENCVDIAVKLIYMKD